MSRGRPQVGLERGQAEEHVQAVRAAGAGAVGQDRQGEQVSAGTGGIMIFSAHHCVILQVSSAKNP